MELISHPTCPLLLDARALTVQSTCCSVAKDMLFMAGTEYSHRSLKVHLVPPLRRFIGEVPFASSQLMQVLLLCVFINMDEESS